MLPLSENCLAIGALLFIGMCVVGLATFIGKLIIWLFGTEQEKVKTTDLQKSRFESPYHEAA
jgi:hypothetical protein